jgi:outer membrane protein assembly factor BamB
MAKGRAVGRFEAMLGVVGLLALGVAYSIATGWNPLPRLQGWLDRTRTLAEPAPAWTVTTTDEPSAAVAVGNSAVIFAGRTATGYTLATGTQQWAREVAWSAVAGSGAGAVVVAGKSKRGYDALEPATGAVRWSDATATGAWTFTDLVVGIACPQPGSCVLTARAPGDGAVRWQVGLPGDVHGLGGANHKLAGVRPLGKATGLPGPVPARLGFPVDDKVQVVDTRGGTRLTAYRSDQLTWATVAGDRVVVTGGAQKKGPCRPRADGRDPAGDREAWHLDGYDLHTGTALGCDQRNEPAGAGGLIDATSPDGHEVLLDPATGGEAFRAGTGEKVIDTDGHLVLVRTADKDAVKAIDIDSGATRWRRSAPKGVNVLLGPGVVVFSDPGSGKLTVVTLTNHVLVDVTSRASVLGYAETGLFVTNGTEVGLVSYGR